MIFAEAWKAGTGLVVLRCDCSLKGVFEVDASALAAHFDTKVVGYLVWIQCSWVAVLSEVFLYSLFEAGEDRVDHCELPVKVRAHLPFHLVELPECENALSDDTPRFVGINIITHNLG